METCSVYRLRVVKRNFLRRACCIRSDRVRDEVVRNFMWCGKVCELRGNRLRGRPRRNGV